MPETVEEILFFELFEWKKINRKLEKRFELISNKMFCIKINSNCLLYLFVLVMIELDSKVKKFREGGLTLSSFIIYLPLDIHPREF